MVNLITGKAGVRIGGLNTTSTCGSTTANARLAAFVLRRTSVVHLRTPRVGAVLKLRTTSGKITLAFAPSRRNRGITITGPFGKGGTNGFLTRTVSNSGSCMFILATSDSCLHISATVIGRDNREFHTFG